jgi:hypothetical protein
MWIGIGFAVVAVLFVVYTLWSAPVGYEDENGFHYGEKK